MEKIYIFGSQYMSINEVHLHTNAPFYYLSRASYGVQKFS